MSIAKNWAFTDFEELDWRAIYNSAKEKIRYICVGREVCPDSGRSHNQGWIQFEKKIRMTGIKKLVGSKQLHLEVCKKPALANDRYCKKGGDFWTAGEFTRKGQRTDLAALAAKIDKGATLHEVAKEDPAQFMQYHRGLAKYKELADAEARRGWRQVEVILLTGPTGCGKTRLAMEDDEKEPGSVFKIQGADLKWFDGYDGEKTILIDEYANDVKVTRLLALLDGYRLRLPIKGGFTWANWTKVYITTNLRKLHECARDEHQAALARRITETKSWWQQEMIGGVRFDGH